MQEHFCKVCGGDHSTGFCTTPEGKKQTEKRMIEQAQTRVGKILLDRGILTSEELGSLSSDRLDEILVRSGHELESLPEEIPEEARKWMWCWCLSLASSLTHRLRRESDYFFIYAILLTHIRQILEYPLNLMNFSRRILL
ncbi:hypothetical protein HY733_02370 [Candidatus Uhrbacteria bacterium]|nr:hypothetical protein [Candidatus Uhrbacteria bacterium]